jgi:tetratricopeptide (TPR) repeat protein
MRALLLRFAILLAASAMAAPLGAAEGGASDLARQAERLIDLGHADAKRLDEADRLIEAALSQDAKSTHALSQKARLTLVRGTDDDGVKPAALMAAAGILNRAFFELRPDVRILALRGHVSLLLKDEMQAFRSLRQAETLDPDDPWMRLYLAEYQRKTQQGDALANLEAAIRIGIPDLDEMKGAVDLALPSALVARDRAKADMFYQRQVALRPGNAFVHGNYALNVLMYFGDFEAGEKLAREAIGIADYPHARGTLSLALYGQWAQAVKEGKGPEVAERLFKAADANDPGGRQLPSCASAWKPTRFVFEALERKQIRREVMRPC